MTAKKFNLLEELVKPRVSKTVLETQEKVEPPFRQSLEPPPEQVPPISLDTTTPALTDKTVRRFDMNDLPIRGTRIYPYLKELYPHMHERMYGGWLRGCINDNACHFVCTARSVSFSFVAHEPMNSVPYIDLKFMLGQPDDFKTLYDDLISWGKSLGASHIRQSQYDLDDLAQYIPDVKLESYPQTRIDLSD